MVIGKEIRELSDKELSVISINLGIERLKVKDNFKEIMYKIYPGEYNEKDDEFFNRYAGKEVLAFPYNKNYKDDDWFIVSDNNYCLTRECFETVAQQPLSGYADAPLKSPPKMCHHIDAVQIYCLEHGHDKCPICGGDFR